MAQCNNGWGWKKNTFKEKGASLVATSQRCDIKNMKRCFFFNALKTLHKNKNEKTERV